MNYRMILVLGAIGGLGMFGCDPSESKSAKDLVPKTTDLGTGLNAVERTYQRPAYELEDIVAAVLKSFDLTMESDKHDELGGEIVALRADGHKVMAMITSVDKDHSQISIRVAPGNRNLAEMIQDRIAEKVKALLAK